MFSLSETQRAALKSIADAPGLIAIVHFAKLRDAGFVESQSDIGSKRGYAGAKITDAGHRALAEG